MDRLERFYTIDRLLKERRVVSFRALAEALEVSRATLKRDLEFMRDRFNAPIEYDREANGYRLGRPRAGPAYELPGLWLNASEVHALLTMRELLSNLQPGLLGPHVAPLQERLRGLLGTGDHAADEVEKRIRILQPGRRESKPAHFSVIAAAVLRRRRLQIRHYSRERDAETGREVSPQRLTWYRDNWYLDAWCHWRDDLRSFAVDAIREAALADKRAIDVPKAKLDEYLKAGYGIFAGRDVEWAVLRFSREAARWVSAQSWHSQQRARTEPDGRYVLEIPYSDDRELAMEILRFGPEVEVLSPESLRKKIRDQLAAALTRY